MRKSGVLLSITSLPSEYGIGSMGEEAYKFVRQLERSGQKLWQILPLGPTGYGDSPYQSFSVFAGNPYLIDLDILCKEQLLLVEECENEKSMYSGDYVDYGRLYESRFELLWKAYTRAKLDADEEYIRFKRMNRDWLDDYALFMAIKEAQGNISLAEWPLKLRIRDGYAIDNCRSLLKEKIGFHVFMQYVFWKQWFKLKTYANERGIEIIGDIPIYVSYDSVDVWTHPELFELDENMLPVRVAGCPPDAFSEDGQLWGNPVYRWEVHKAQNYAWWIKRMSASLRTYDVVRIDHFRGFDSFYAIPYGQKTARNGVWEDGPGYDLFMHLENALGKMNIIAEDLGYITESVIELLEKTGYPGMKVLQFAFDSREESDYMPHKYDKNCVVYTGTHDNDTVLGWYDECERKDQRYAKEYLNVTRKDQIPGAMIRCCFASVADTVIIPMQDYLKMGSKGRMNIPATVGTNWRWRMIEGEYSTELEKYMKSLTSIYRR